MKPLNVIKLTEYLSHNIDGVITVLESLGYINIKYYASRNELRFPREEGRNPSSVSFNLDTLKYKCFSTNAKGDLYSLIMNKKKCKFPEALKYVTNILGLEKELFNQEIKLPFGGFYKKLIKDSNEPELYIKTYDESILEPFLYKYNTLFFEDGINYQTQEEFKIGFDIETCRITIPEYTFDGKLCGIMGRLNDKNCAKEERWLPIIPCSRSLTLFGYHQNYQTIQEKGLCIIGESEKFVLQLHSFNCHIGLATCGNHISSTQEKYIKGLLVPKIILAYDESLEEEYIREEAKKLKVDNHILKNNVGYIFDNDNTYLPKGSKAAPSDFGREVFYRLLKEKVVWI